MVMSRLFCSILAGFLALSSVAQPVRFTTAFERPGLWLDGEWRSIVDPFENGYYSYRYEPLADGYFENRKPASPSDLVEYDFDTSPVLAVPGDWNSQRPELMFYEGTVWYKRSFTYEPSEGYRTFLHFGAANYEARVYLNGVELGVHTGGFTPFSFEVTDVVTQGENFVVVKVDNRRLREGVPTVNTDWWNYGGLTRRVKLVEVPDTFIRDFVVQLGAGGRSHVVGRVQLDGSEPQQVVRLEIPGAGISHVVTADKNGIASFDFEADLELWSPDRPRLYDVTVRAETDHLSDRIGFRQIEVDGTNILLNGEPIFLRGISIHEEAPIRGGRAHRVEDARTLLGWAKDLGCNFVRLAHYPHSETMVREADRLGLMVWSEIPVYWTILWDNPGTLDLALQQLEEMIFRDRNRASIIIWSVANETPRTPERLAFLKRLIDRSRQLDDTRLMSAATELSYTGNSVMVDDPLASSLDVIGANEYVGWYSRSVEDIELIEWATAFDKPLIISEFGGGAKYGYRGPETTRWTEDYQAALYRNQIEMLRKIPFLAGMSPWILADFRSPRRPLPGIQNYWNRKGLVSERGNRKMAFYVLQKFYREVASAE
jgi:beta-glucuronidase